MKEEEEEEEQGKEIMAAHHHFLSATVGENKAHRRHRLAAVMFEAFWKGK
jgi:hypothetical protein